MARFDLQDFCINLIEATVINQVLSCLDILKTRSGNAYIAYFTRRRRHIISPRRPSVREKPIHREIRDDC